MNILIDIGHPAHVHYYKNLAHILEQNGHKIIWTVKDLPSAINLLDKYGFNYIKLPKKSNNLTGKIFKQIEYDYLILKICKKYKINIAIGISVSIAHVSKISKVKSIVFDDDDDEVQPLVTKFVNPFADYLLSPDALKGHRKRKDTIFYPGYHELAYLHPNRFTPDISVLDEIGLKENEPYFIMRFNAFTAHHDIGIKGISLEQKNQLINILEPYGKIFITTEKEIEPEFKKYQLTISPEKMHSLLYYATMFIGDSQTMTSEAAMLGTPSLRCNSFAKSISYLNEEEKRYGLTYSFYPNEFNILLKKLNELLLIPNLKEYWIKRRDKMLCDKIDVTMFWYWFIDNLPESPTYIKSNENIWSKFK